MFAWEAEGMLPTELCRDNPKCWIENSGFSGAKAQKDKGRPHRFNGPPGAN